MSTGAGDGASDGDPKRLGIYGGTFDPVHWGHLLLAETAREACELDEVWFVPSGSPPHKQGRPLTEPRHRINMLELALTGLPWFSVSRIEIGADQPTYTVDTLKRLAAMHPQSELFFLMGADSLADLPTWRQPDRIAELATIVAVNRGDSDAAIPSECDSFADRITLTQMPASGLSATDLRERAATGRSLLFRTPRAVEIYIGEHRLYVSKAEAAQN